MFCMYAAHDHCMSSLLNLLLRLLFVIFQVHQRFLGQLQIPLQLPLHSFQVHPDLLLLLQRTFNLDSKLYKVNYKVKRRQCFSVLLSTVAHVVHLLLELGLGFGQ